MMGRARKSASPALSDSAISFGLTALILGLLRFCRVKLSGGIGYSVLDA
jgi:hypothetical protein